MRNVSEATKITKVVGKVLALLEKEQLSEEQIASVLKATEETLGMNTFVPTTPCANDDTIVEE